MPNTAQQTIAAREDPELTKIYLDQLLAASKFWDDAIRATNVDPDLDRALAFEDELKKAVARRIINQRGKQTLYANTFLDNALSSGSLDLNYARFDVSGVANVTPVQISFPASPPIDFVKGSVVYATGFNKPSDFNGKSFIVSSTSATTIDLHDMTNKPVDGRNLDIYDGGGHIYRNLPEETVVRATIDALFNQPDFLINLLSEVG